MASITSIVLEIIVGIIILAPVLWLVGKVIIGKDKFTHAVLIVVLGVIVNAILGTFVHGLLGLIVTLLIWVGLIKHFFETNWVKAALVGVVAIVVLAIIAVVLVALGIGALASFGRMA